MMHSSSSSVWKHFPSGPNSLLSPTHLELELQSLGWRPSGSLTQQHCYTWQSFNFTSFTVDLCCHLHVFSFSKVRAFKQYDFTLMIFFFNFWWATDIWTLRCFSPSRLLRVRLAFSDSCTEISTHLYSIMSFENFLH